MPAKVNYNFGEEHEVRTVRDMQWLGEEERRAAGTCRFQRLRRTHHTGQESQAPTEPGQGEPEVHCAVGEKQQAGDHTAVCGRNQTPAGKRRRPPQINRTHSQLTACCRRGFRKQSPTNTTSITDTIINCGSLTQKRTTLSKEGSWPFVHNISIKAAAVAFPSLLSSPPQKLPP